MSTPHFSELRRLAIASDEVPGPFVGFMGEIGLASELAVLVSTHALNYGSSLFEGIRAFRQPNGRLAVWLLDAHLDRMFHSLQLAKMKPPVDRATMAQQILDVVALNDDLTSESIYIRPLCWRGEGLGVDASGIDNHFAVLTRPWGVYVAKSYNDGAKVYVSRRSRPTIDMVNGTAKHAGFYGLWSVPEKLTAKEYGCDEAIFAPGPNYYVQDGTGQEVMFWTKDGERLVLQSAGDSSGANILHSTTRQFLTEGLLPKDAWRFPYREVPSFPLLREELQGMALVGTASGVVPVTCLWVPPISANPGSEWNPEVLVGGGYAHPKVVALAAFYQAVVSGQYPEYEHLLTPVPMSGEVIARTTRDNLITDTATRRYKMNESRRQQMKLPLQPA